jgi:hypothetical protein
MELPPDCEKLRNPMTPAPASKKTARREAKKRRSPVIIPIFVREHGGKRQPVDFA